MAGGAALSFPFSPQSRGERGEERQRTARIGYRTHSSPRADSHSHAPRPKGKEAPAGDVFLRLHHDEDVAVYVNGVEAYKAGGWAVSYGTVPVAAAARKALKPGKNTLAVYCRQTFGGQYIDVGMFELGRARK